MFTRHVTERRIAAPPAEVWELLANPHSWPEWAPVIADVACREGLVTAGTRGEILVVPGVWLPFHVSSVKTRPRRSWIWRVAGGPAIDHSVVADRSRRGGSIVRFTAPLWLPGVFVIPARALHNLARIVEA